MLKGFQISASNQSKAICSSPRFHRNFLHGVSVKTPVTYVYISRRTQMTLLSICAAIAKIFWVCKKRKIKQIYRSHGTL